MDIKSKLAGLKNAQIFERGVFLQPGQYDLRVDKFVAKDSRKSGDLLIVEFTVDKTSDEKVHPVGSKASWCQKLTDKDVALGALKEFFYALLGYEWPKDKEECIKKVDPNIEELANEAVEKGALNGKRISVQTFMKKTSRGSDFTVHRWMPAK